MKIREKVVGAKGFEPSTSWSRTMNTQSNNAFSWLHLQDKHERYVNHILRKMVVTRGVAFWHYNEIASAAKQGRFLRSGKSSSQLSHT
jgi:hypothetical protein